MLKKIIVILLSALTVCLYAQSDLFNVLESSSCSEIEAALGSTDINVQDNSGNTLLIAAIEKGKNETAKMLLTNGINPYTPNNDGYTAFMAAANKGNMEIMMRMDEMDLLKSNSAYLTQTDNSGKSALDYALGSGSSYAQDFINSKIKEYDAPAATTSSTSGSGSSSSADLEELKEENAKLKQELTLTKEKLDEFALDYMESVKEASKLRKKLEEQSPGVRRIGGDSEATSNLKTEIELLKKENKRIQSENKLLMEKVNSLSEQLSSALRRLNARTLVAEEDNTREESALSFDDAEIDSSSLLKSVPGVNTIGEYKTYDADDVIPNGAFPATTDDLRHIKNYIRSGHYNTAETYFRKINIDAASSIDPGRFYHYKGITAYMLAATHKGYINSAILYLNKAAAYSKSEGVKAYSMLLLASIYEQYYNGSEKNLRYALYWIERLETRYANTKYYNDSQLYKAIIYKKLGNPMWEQILLDVKNAQTDGYVYSRWNRGFIDAKEAYKFVAGTVYAADKEYGILVE